MRNLTRSSLSLLLALLPLACRSAPPGAGFATPEAALRELGETIGSHDRARVERLFGPGGPELLASGDEVADREDALRVQQFLREKLAFEERGADARIALLGSEAWPFPIPLVRADGRWHFDVEAGAEELANRRVGRNELSTIASLHACVDAQREYAAVARDGEPRTFASRFFSSPGKHDGLYWPAGANEPASPLGERIAEAARSGYTPGANGPQPFHGYCFRMLTRQGSHAPGGAKSYLDERGRMRGGFALLAWPAKYGASGVMSFVVDQQGIVYQRDLGAQTEQAAARIEAFDPDASWDPARD